MRPTTLFFLCALLAAGLWSCTPEESADDDDIADDDTGDDDTGDDDTGDDDTSDDDTSDDDTGDDDTGDDDTGDDDTGDDDTGDDDDVVYTVTSSSDSWSSISNTGTALANPVATVTLPFDVTFYGDSYPSGSGLEVHELGVLGFSSMIALVPGDAAHYQGAGVTPCIAAHHHSSLEASMVYLVAGASPNQTLTIEWNGTYMLEFGRVEAQVHFSEGSDEFEIRYGNMEADAFAPTSWTLLTAKDGTSFNETYVSNSSAVDPGTLDNTTWTYVP